MIGQHLVSVRACGRVPTQTQGAGVDSHRAVRSGTARSQPGGWGEGGRSERYHVKPASVTAGSDGAVLAVSPAQRMRAYGHKVGFLLPSLLARDRVDHQPIRKKTQIIIVQFRGNFPPEGQGARAVNCGLHKGLLVVSDGAARGAVGTFVSIHSLACPSLVGLS